MGREIDTSAAELLNDVIERLFGTAMGLSAAATLARQPEVRDRLADAIDELDATISHIRRAVWDELAPPAPTEVTTARPRILVVDDDDDIREIFTRTLTRELQADVSASPDGYQGLAILETQACDAMVLDLMLPGIGGDVLLDRMADRGIDVPTVVISGLTSGPIVDRVSAHPAVREVLAKPIDLHRLASSAQRALAG